MVKNLPSNAGVMGLIVCRETKISPAAGQLSPCATREAPQTTGMTSIAKTRVCPSVLHVFASCVGGSCSIFLLNWLTRS